MKKLLIIASLILSATCNAQKTDYLEPLKPSVTVNDRKSGQPLGISGYNTYDASNFWGFNQWLNPTNMLPQTFSYGSTWEIGNNTSRLKFYPTLNGKTTVYEIAGAHLPCINAEEGNVPLEMDLLLQPRENFRSAALGNMAQLKLAVNLQGVHSEIEPGCNYSQSGYLASLILESTSGQTLFVQINFGGTHPPPFAIWCPDFELAAPNTLLENRFCLDDSVTTYGGSYIYGVGGGSYTLDILPRLLQIIQSNHKKSGSSQKLLDPNPNKWHIVNFYMGMVNHGKAVTTTQWSSPILQSIEGTFCSGSTKVQFICEAPVTTNGWNAQTGGCYQKLSTIPCQ